MNYLKLLWNLYGIKRNTKKTPEQIRILQEKGLIVSFLKKEKIAV